MKRAYHHTAPINALYGLHEALVIFQQESLEKDWARHQYNRRALVGKVWRIGLMGFACNEKNVFFFSVRWMP